MKFKYQLFYVDGDNIWHKHALVTHTLLEIEQMIFEYCNYDDYPLNTHKIELEVIEN